MQPTVVEGLFCYNVYVKSFTSFSPMYVHMFVNKLSGLRDTKERPLTTTRVRFVKLMYYRGTLFVQTYNLSNCTSFMFLSKFILRFLVLNDASIYIKEVNRLKVGLPI